MTDPHYVRHPDAATASVDGQTVVLSATDRRYHALNTTAAALWRLIEQPSTVDEVSATLVRSFDVDPDTCRREVTAGLQEMVDDGLAVVSGPSGELA